MKYLSIVASIFAYAATMHSAVLAQGGSTNPGGPEQPCTLTVSTCPPFTSGGYTATITVYEQPFVSTSTVSYDCEGCSEVTVVPRDCGVGPVVPVPTTTTFVYDNAQSTTTVDVCSPTPN